MTTRLFLLLALGCAFAAGLHAQAPTFLGYPVLLTVTDNGNPTCSSTNLPTASAYSGSIAMVANTGATKIALCRSNGTNWINPTLGAVDPPSPQWTVGVFQGPGTTAVITGATNFMWCQGTCGPNNTAGFISVGQPISSADSTVLGGVFNNPTAFSYTSSTTQTGYEFISGSFPLTAQAQAYGRGNGVDILTACTGAATGGRCCR